MQKKNSNSITNRRDRVGTLIEWELCKQFEFTPVKKCYLLKAHKIKSILFYNHLDLCGPQENAKTLLDI